MRSEFQPRHPGPHFGCLSESTAPPAYILSGNCEQDSTLPDTLKRLVQPFRMVKGDAQEPDRRLMQLHGLHRTWWMKRAGVRRMCEQATGDRITPWARARASNRSADYRQIEMQNMIMGKRETIELHGWSQAAGPALCIF
jgi:hypothetical protein